ncbi:MAG: FHA domain-containing protein, partial [Deltaproteobacteria bacterium]|nr:FHA domain-containing protein [Deltaproteobacteria bacterium]
MDAQTRKKLPQELGALVVFTQGSEKGRQFPLIYMRTIMGRTKGDILVRDLAVSSKHLAIDYRRGKFHVLDNESKNGTFINEKRVLDHHVFIEQDIRIGDSLFHIELDQERAQALIE